MDDRRPNSFAERIRSERRLGVVFAIGIGAVVAAVLAIGDPARAVAGLVVIAIVIALRELVDVRRVNRRAWRKAVTTLPQNIDNAVFLRGVARPLDQRVVAPYSLRECLAYRARFTGTRGDDGERTPGEVRERVADLIVVVGDAKILIEGDSVRVAADPCAGDAAPVLASADRVDVFVPMSRELATHARHQEVLLLPGDEVVVVGYLVAERQRGATHRLIASGTLVVKPAELADAAVPLDADALAKLPKVRARPYRQAG